MPQIKSAIKRVKTQAVANERNAAQLSTMRTGGRSAVNQTRIGPVSSFSCPGIPRQITLLLDLWYNLN